MEFKMIAKLDGLYYRTSATPSLCGPYKTTTNYNGCTPAQGQKTQAFSRTDFTRDDVANAKMISAADQAKYRQILQYPKSLGDILGSEAEQRNFIKKFPNLETILKPMYPKLFAEGYKNPSDTTHTPKSNTTPKPTTTHNPTPTHNPIPRVEFTTPTLKPKQPTLKPTATYTPTRTRTEGYYYETPTCSSCSRRR